MAITDAANAVKNAGVTAAINLGIINPPNKKDKENKTSPIIGAGIGLAVGLIVGAVLKKGLVGYLVSGATGAAFGTGVVYFMNNNSASK